MVNTTFFYIAKTGAALQLEATIAAALGARYGRGRHRTPEEAVFAINVLAADAKARTIADQLAALYSPNLWKRTWIMQIEIAPTDRDDTVRIRCWATRGPDLM